MEIFSDYTTGEQAWINIVDDEAVEVILLSERSHGNHDVAYRYNGVSQDGDWQLGTLEDADAFAKAERQRLADAAADAAEHDNLIGF